MQRFCGEKTTTEFLPGETKIYRFSRLDILSLIQRHQSSVMMQKLLSFCTSLKSFRSVDPNEWERKYFLTEQNVLSTTDIVY